MSGVDDGEFKSAAGGVAADGAGTGTDLTPASGAPGTIGAPTGPVAGPPLAVSLDENAPSTGTFAQLLQGASSPMGYSLTVTDASIEAAYAADGTLTLDPVGQTVTFTPAAGFTGEVIANYTISDGHGGFATMTITLTVRTSCHYC